MKYDLKIMGIMYIQIQGHFKVIPRSNFLFSKLRGLRVLIEL